MLTEMMNGGQVPHPSTPLSAALNTCFLSSTLEEKAMLDRLTKSIYFNGLQCRKYPWIACNEPEKIPEPDSDTQHNLDRGYLLVKLAKSLFSECIDLPSEVFVRYIAIAKGFFGKESRCLKPAC